MECILIKRINNFFHFTFLWLFFAMVQQFQNPKRSFFLFIDASLKDFSYKIYSILFHKWGGESPRVICNCIKEHRNKKLIIGWLSVYFSISPIPLFNHAFLHSPSLSAFHMWDILKGEAEREAGGGKRHKLGRGRISHFFG